MSLNGVLIPDDGFIEITCQRGHHTATIIQQTKFEILSQLAIKAGADGNYRDTIASFAASLERLFEFFVEATCRKNGVEKKVFVKAWKNVASQSERQLGTFVAAYILETREAAKLLPSQQASLRNKVIHNGMIPNNEQAMRFGQAVTDCAKPLIQLLRNESFSEMARTLIFERMDECHKRAQNLKVSASTLSMNTFFNLGSMEQELNVEAAVTYYKKRPNILPIEALRGVPIRGS